MDDSLSHRNGEVTEKKQGGDCVNAVSKVYRWPIHYIDQYET